MGHGVGYEEREEWYEWVRGERQTREREEGRKGLVEEGLEEILIPRRAGRDDDVDVGMENTCTCTRICLCS